MKNKRVYRAPQNCLIEEAMSFLESDEKSALRSLHLLHQKIQDAEKLNPKFKGTREIFSQALLTLNEARHELQDLASKADCDPESLTQIESRLSVLYDVARKHKVRPEDLYAHFIEIKASLDELDSFQDQKLVAEQTLNEARNLYNSLAKKMSQLRGATAKKLAKAVNEMLPKVALQHAEFEITLQSNESAPSDNGWDALEFLIATGPQQHKAPLAKVVSGGELSRISLIIQVLTKGQKRPPCLVFDEVDTGISGQTASVVGKLLQQLSKDTQIICITHLPQVAALGDHHYLVSKTISKNNVESTIACLSEKERLDALASLLGGLSSKEAALSHAKALREEALI